MHIVVVSLHTDVSVHSDILLGIVKASD